MRLESALYSSRSGLDAHGQALGVIGDNVANSNTVGYKRARVEFSDLFAEGPTGAASYAGPQAGNGVQLKTVRQNQEVGVIENTARDLDAAIEGRGFFITGSETEPQYTRAGNFQMRPDGVLTTVDGDPVLGYVDGGTTLTEINLVQFENPVVAPTTAMALFGNLDSTSDSSQIPAQIGLFRDISRSANFFTAQDVYDSLGERHAVSLAFYRAEEANTWTAIAYMNAGDLGGEDFAPVEVGRTTLEFNNLGRITEENLPTAQFQVTAPYSNGAEPGNFTIDLSKFSQFAGPSVLTAAQVDGRSVGEIEGYEITESGDVMAVFQGGGRAVAGTLALAAFNNDEGLGRAGENSFQESLTTGPRTVGVPGTSFFGTLAGFSLERSTVDIAGEFVDLTLYQRAYQANSQTLNATSQLLRETIQLIR
jgi:flagellar hook protein FlgE